MPVEEAPARMRPLIPLEAFPPGVKQLAEIGIAMTKMTITLALLGSKTLEMNAMFWLTGKVVPR